MTRPYKRRSMIDSDDVQQGADIGRAPEELREGGVELEDIEIVPEHKMRSKAQEAKFMNELVTVEIEGDDEPNSPVFICSGHNGVMQYIERSKPQSIKRRYLYSLLAAKRINFASAFGKDGSGNEFNRLKGSARSSHRIRLIEDKNPEAGMKWFQTVSASLSKLSATAG